MIGRRIALTLTLAAVAFGMNTSGVAGFLAALADHGASSQATGTIKIVVPYPPGGGADILARLLAEQIRRAQGLTIVIENRAGAAGVIGTEAASRAVPDGNTVLIAASDLIIIPHLRKLNYDPMTSFEPICQLVSVPLVIAVNSKSPHRTLADLLDAARAKPGHLTLATNTGGLFQIGFEMLKRAAKFEMTYVPYTGAAPAVTALLGEHVTAAFYGYPGVVEQLKSGRLRALATTSRNRIESIPDVPTVAEYGYKDYEVNFWFGLFTPARTPKDAASRLAGWVTAAMRTPEVKSKLSAQGYYPVGMCGEDFAALLRKQYDEYGRVIREANIKAE
jgi:tripartite-type tricarboxylate transporter receptor subunit TctC